MKIFVSIEDVAQYLGDGGSYNPDVEYQTTGEVVDELVRLGSTDKVYAFHDDHLGLRDNLSREFLRSPLSDADHPRFESERENVLEQANRIISLWERELSDYDLEDIRDDQIYRGQDPD